MFFQEFLKIYVRIFLYKNSMRVSPLCNKKDALIGYIRKQTEYFSNLRGILSGTFRDFTNLGKNSSGIFEWYLQKTARSSLKHFFGNLREIPARKDSFPLNDSCTSFRNHWEVVQDFAVSHLKILPEIALLRKSLRVWPENL